MTDDQSLDFFVVDRLYHHAEVSKGKFTRITVASWFKRPLYYQVALVYMLTRLTTNVSQVCMAVFSAVLNCLMQFFDIHA